MEPNSLLHQEQEVEPQLNLQQQTTIVIEDVEVELPELELENINLAGNNEVVVEQPENE